MRRAENRDGGRVVAFTCPAPLAGPVPVWFITQQGRRLQAQGSMLEGARGRTPGPRISGALNQQTSHLRVGPTD
jgi:hypothetical protein